MLFTQVGVGLSDLAKGVDCGIDVANAALDSLGTDSIGMAMLFVSHSQPAQVLKGVNSVLGNIPLIGASSAGEYTHQGYVQEGAGLMLISGDNFAFHPLSYQRRWFRDSRLLGKLMGISESGLGTQFQHRTLMLFPDDRTMNMDQIVERAMTETAMLYDILGGPGPTIPTSVHAPVVFHNNRVIKTGLVGAEVLSQQPVGLALANGWTPLSGPYRVTRIDERRIVKIDGRPAHEVYEDFLFEQEYAVDTDISPDLLLTHPVGVCKDTACKVSVLMGIDNAGSLIVTSPPPEGSLIHILTTEPDAMVGAANRAIRQAKQTMLGGEDVAGLLFIDCMSTAMYLKEAHAQQRDAVHQTVGDVPFLSYRSHGVLARLQGQTAGHYECSVAAFVIPT